MKNKLTKLLLLATAYLLITLAFASGRQQAADAATQNQFETRCGWLSNPTPGNIWLYDRDDEWTIGVQGGYQVERYWDWPTFKPGQWVKTNVGSYGYGCVCLRLRVDRDTKKVLEIDSARAQALTVCRQDRTLKKWKDKLE